VCERGVPLENLHLMRMLQRFSKEIYPKQIHVFPLQSIKTHVHLMICLHDPVRAQPQANTQDPNCRQADMKKFDDNSLMLPKGIRVVFKPCYNSYLQSVQTN